MFNRVKEIISKDFEEIKSTSLSLELLKIYSILYLYGRQPNSCEKSLRKYYEQLKKDGIMKANEDHKKTCIVNWKGNRYISKEARHFNNESITDAQAIDLLKRKHLSENDFITLPEGYNNKSKRELLLEEAVSLKLTIAKNISNKKLQELIDEAKAEKRKLLLEEAVSLKIEFSEDIETDELIKLIDEAKAE